MLGQSGDECQRAVEAGAEALGEHVVGVARAVLAGSFPASLASSRRANAGTSRAAITASEPIASGHGRACTISLQRRHVAPGAERRNRPRPRGRTSLGPKRDSIAGSSVSDAASVNSTASTEAIASPYMKLIPVANMPSSAITTVAPASRIARPEVSIASSTDRFTSPRRRVVLPKAGDDEQRIVDPDAEPDHQRELGSDAGHACDVGREPGQRNARDQAEARGDQRHAGRDQGAERQQQNHQRRDHADGGSRADAEALGVLDHLAAGGHAQTGHVHSLELIEHPGPVLLDSRLACLS